MSAVRYSVEHKQTHHFGKWISFRPQVRGCKPPILISGVYAVSLRAQQSVFQPLTWGRRQIQFPKRRVLQNTGRWTKSKIPVISSCQCIWCRGGESKRAFARYEHEALRLCKYALWFIDYFVCFEQFKSVRSDLTRRLTSVFHCHDYFRYPPSTRRFCHMVDLSRWKGIYQQAGHRKTR
jgi:hypothetical protein